ncbi:MAG TPA: serine hydrolase domain-containing protein [Candidatus Sulfotelmatobacter sp.]|nr:serine hydrolase domain-containing protein [Candidatus Sulfotelmatobacter sp.]
MRSKLAFVPLLCISLICVAQTQFPDTPAGHQCSAWLESFNRGDINAHREFLQKNYPSAVARLDRQMEFRQRTGGFDLKKIEESTPTKIAVLVQERSSDQMARLTMEVHAEDPHQISSIELRAIPRPADFAIPRLSQSELISAARKDIDSQVASDTFSGTVLIAKDGKSVFSEAYGLADREHKVPNTLKTRFRIGSMNKMFTAVSTLQLVQSGKLDLKGTVGKYLTDYPNKDIASKVTIEQLLTHTGGTGDFFGPEFDAHRLELRTLQDYMKLYGNRAPKFEPGTQWEYSNYGFLLLGAIIEKVSGQSYYDYVREHVYTPAGMASTGSEPEDQAVPDRSVGYTKMDSTVWKPNTDTLPYRGTSAGGGYSTVEDLARFAQALTGHRLLDAHYTEMLTTGKPGTPDNTYAFGFEDRLVNGVRCFGHGGGAPGMNGDLRICPSAGYVVAVLANLDPPAATRVSDFIVNRLPEK